MKLTSALIAAFMLLGAADASAGNASDGNETIALRSHGGPPSQTAPMPAPLRLQPAPREVPEKYNETTAVLIPLFTSAATIGVLSVAGSTENDGLIWLGLAGLVLAPGAGEVYTHDWGHFWRGMGLRVSGMALTVVGTAILLDDCLFADTDCSSPAGTIGLIGGLGLYAAGTIYSIFGAPGSARKMNRKAALTISPAPIRGPGRSLGWGGQLSLQF